MRIALGSDHAGYALKNHMLDFLTGLGHAVQDHGTISDQPADYPAIAGSVCHALLEGHADRGILVCGSGVGMSIAANRFPGIRAVLGMDLYLARFSRLHNDANVLCLAGRLLGEGLADEIAKTWLETAFEGGRHQRRVDMLDELVTKG